MPKRLNDFVDVKVAVAPTSSSGAITGIAIDASSYGRARFVFQFGSGAAEIAALSGNIGIWQAATSGGTYANISGANLSAVTSGVMSGAKLAMVIDVPVDADTEWLKVSGNIISSMLFHSAVVELYDGINRPPTTSAQELVTV
jgi:hypothetical protein